MATPWTHAFFALAAGKTAFRRKVPLRFWILTAICAAIPDVDVSFRWFGASGEIWRHRGITHSLLAAVMIGLAAAFIARGWQGRTLGEQEDGVPVRRRATFLLSWLTFTLATASHLFLDMLSGSWGVALLAPFDASHYSFPWHPVWYMPEWAKQMFPSLFERGLRPMWLVRATVSEVVVVWVPMTLLMVVSRLIRFRKKAVIIPLDSRSVTPLR
jgi:inner membrane protein